MGTCGSHDDWISNSDLDNCCTEVNRHSEEFSRLYEWNSLIISMNKFLNWLKSDRGSIESAMVLVPLLVLFLVGMQIATAAHFRNLEKISAQDEATTRGIYGNFAPDDEFIHIDSSGDGQNLDLVVTNHSHQLSNLIPGFLSGVSGSRAIDVYGIAIVENQR
jgi:hypothetical protein